MPITTALYLRQSSDHHADYLAVTRQREACLNTVKQRGWVVAAEFVDNDVSASKRHVRRPQYEAMLEAFASGQIRAIVCHDLDRLTRQPRQIEDLIDLAEQHGLVVVTSNGDFDLSHPNGQLQARIRASVARDEVTRKSRRQLAANRQQVELGRQIVATRALGWTQDGQIDQEEAQQVRAFFDGFAAGESLRNLALNATVPPRRSDRWSPNAVRFILTNPRYCGRLTYRGEVLADESDLPAIVDADLFDAVNARLSDPRRRTTKEGTHRKHLGSGLYQCVNGHTMHSANASYRCGESCYARTREPIDALIRDLVAARLDMPDAHVSRDQVDGGAAAQVRSLRDRLVAVEADYDAGLIDGRRLKAATEKINAELGEAEARLAKSMNPVVAVENGEEFLALPLMRQRAVVDMLLTVTLLPAPKGVKGFNPASVRVDWK